MRPSKIAEYLPGFGHDILVLTHTYGPSKIDDSVLRILDPSFNRYRVGFKRFVWLGNRLYCEIRNRCGRYHSIYSRWLARAMSEFKAEIDAFSPELVFASYSPVESLELGLSIAGERKIPLISDFRDGLLYEPIEEKLLNRHASVAAHYTNVEKRAVQESRVITCALPGLCHYFENHYDISTAIALPNAFDRSDFDDLPHIDLSDEFFHIVHTGSFALSDITCDITPWVQALETLLHAHQGLASRVRWHQLGRLNRKEQKLLSNLVSRGIVIDHGEVHRSHCLAFQKRADLLLLITSVTRKSVTPGKIFEYLCAGRPILGLTDGSFAAEILMSTGAGRVVHPARINEIQLALLDAINGNWDLEPNIPVIEEFSIDAQMKKLDHIIRELHQQ